MNFQLPRRHTLKVHLAALAALNAALFLPLIGRGYIQDDFVWIYDAAFQSRWYGFTHTTGGPFYSPIAWLTFKADWLLWGAPPFLLATENLALHTLNVVLLYALALQLWRSKSAAWWTGLGYSLLFQANTWAMMWISTRAHILATFFYLAALNATLRYLRDDKDGLPYAVAAIAFAASAIFSKEIGVTVVASMWLLAAYEQRSHNRKLASARNVILFAIMLAVLAAYLALRAKSGAVPIFSQRIGYRYRIEPHFFLENLIRYSWRTFGLLIILGSAVFAFVRIRPLDGRLLRPIIRRVLLSVALFAIGVTPVILLDERSGIYTYLPGYAAALALGATTLATTWPGPETPFRRLRSLPIILVVGVYCAFTVGHSLRWLRMARTNTEIMNQIVAQRPNADPDTIFLLIYSKEDSQHRFPESFRYGFRYAIRLAYKDNTIDGLIIGEDEAAHRRVRRRRTELRFLYIEGADPPRVVEVGRNQGRIIQSY